MFKSSIFPLHCLIFVASSLSRGTLFFPLDLIFGCILTVSVFIYFPELLLCDGINWWLPPDSLISLINSPGFEFLISWILFSPHRLPLQHFSCSQNVLHSIIVTASASSYKGQCLPECWVINGSGRSWQRYIWCQQVHCSYSIEVSKPALNMQTQGAVSHSDPVNHSNA